MGGGESGQVEGEASAAGVTEKKTKRKTKAQKAKEKEVIEGRVKQVMMKSMSELEQQGNPMEEAAQEVTKEGIRRQEEARKYYLGQALVKYVGEGATKYTSGTYLNRHADKQHTEQLVLSYKRWGIIDTKKPVVLIVKKDAVNMAKVRGPDELEAPLQRLEPALGPHEAMLAAGHHRLNALVTFIEQSRKEMVDLSEERELSAVGEGKDGNAPRALEVIDEKMENEQKIWARAHWWTTALYSDGECEDGVDV